MSRLELSFKLKEREILRIFHGYLEDFVEGLKSFVENFVVVFIEDFFKDLFQRCRFKVNDRSSETNASSIAVGGSG